MDQLLTEMQTKGLAYCSRTWILRAIAQHPAKVTIDLATSFPYPRISSLDLFLGVRHEWLRPTLSRI